MHSKIILYIISFWHQSAFAFIDIKEEDYKYDPVQIAYVKSIYEQSLYGIDFLFYPAKQPQRLYVLCNGATIGKYTMWSWFWRDDEVWEDTAYLFLKDDAIRWYLGTQEEPLTDTYCAIINTVMHWCGLTANQVYTIGHSMGGYAALHFALKLGLAGAFVLRPQIDWQTAAQYFSVKKLQDIWVDLDMLVRTATNIPLLYLQYGEFVPDKQAGLHLLAALIEKKAFVILEKTTNEEHTGYHPSKVYIEATLAYMEKMNQLQ